MYTLAPTEEKRALTKLIDRLVSGNIPVVGATRNLVLQGNCRGDRHKDEIVYTLDLRNNEVSLSISTFYGSIDIVKNARNWNDFESIERWMKSINEKGHQSNLSNVLKLVC